MRTFLSAVAIMVVGALSANAQNALKNPGFEEPTVTSGSSIGKWFRFGSGNGGISSESTAMPWSGARHIELETLGTNQFAGVFQTLESPSAPGAARAVAPGEFVKFSGWHMAAGISNQTSEIKLEWRGTPNPPQNRVDVVNVPVGSYSQFVQSGVAPAGTTGLQLTYAITTFGAGQGTQTLVYIDDFQVLTARLPGDYNNNGRVDAGDYVVWRKNVGTTTPLVNDLIGGTIGTAQYDAWRISFGNAIGSGAMATTPDTASGTLIALAALGQIAMRNGRRRTAS